MTLTLGTTIANLGMTETVFPNPVFHGDTIRVETEVLSVREFEIEAGSRHRRIRASRLQPERGAGGPLHPPGDDEEEDGFGLMRSLLFVPGDSERKLEKGFSSEADVVIVDLEDSVSPQNKAAARAMAAEFLRARQGQGGPAVYVRVNDLSTGLTDDDLAALVPARPAGIMLPKSNSGADVQRLSVKLRVLRPRTGCPTAASPSLPDQSPKRPPACWRAASYAGASQRLAGLTWGAEDLSAAVGARATRDEHGRYTDVFRLARAMTILAAAAAEVAAIDTVFPNFRDMDGFRRECVGGRTRRVYRQDGDPSRAGTGHQRGLHAFTRSGRACEGRGERLSGGRKSRGRGTGGADV